MNRNELISAWKAEENIAHIHGWDFSHIHGRFSEFDLPWDYREIVLRCLKPEMKLLDVDTGGGEFLLSLRHPHKNTAATEAWQPNVELCSRTLLPLGIDFREGDGSDRLPYDDESFDIIINRHGDFNPADMYRLLKAGGLFITQQVGAENDRELAELLMGEREIAFPDQYLSKASASFREAGFEIIEEQECFTPIRFFDIGALVWFARVIPWEFPGFSVDGSIDRLMEAQRRLETTGCVEGRAHRFMLIAKKP